MTPQGYPVPARASKDGRVLILDLSPEISYRRLNGSVPSDAATVTFAIRAARWRGVVLPPVDILGAVAYPVVRFTGAHNRLHAGVGPEMAMSVLQLWESGLTTPIAPASPLTIVGFVSTANRWSAAVTTARSVSGLGAGMVLRRSLPRPLNLMDADATGVWVAGTQGSMAQVWVYGRVGAVHTAVRSTAHRRLEEGLFSHALACGAIS